MEGEEHIQDALENGESHGVSGDSIEFKQYQAVNPIHQSNGVKSERRSQSQSPPIDTKGTGENVSTPEIITAPKLSRKSSQKTATRLAPTFAHYPDMTEEACRDFKVIQDCLYGAKYMGSSEHDALDCDCAEEWREGDNHACGEDSDCINRATKMECVDGDCNCGNGCQNQRFQRKQYADVSVIKTEKKGFGLRTNKALQPNDFIFEYIGEVINEPTFRRRMIQYDEGGIKHFYFMSLTKSEFVDATKKGNLGRFCNHSCNPNCYVDKWVVGDKLRMGIFASGYIKAGEELVFNYNVDRYGADPQPCYCGETNCTGFIGGKTQTERATKLPLATIEALGLEDGETWDTAVAKKPRKKKVAEDDEEYVNSMQLHGLTEDGVTKVMAALMQCKEKWIAVKLLRRIQDAQDERVLHRVVRMHGYQILKTTLNTFIDDNNVVLQILDVLYKFPRLTKNKITDSNIENTIEGLVSSEHEDIAAESKRLLDAWRKLETAYRIPRKKNDGTLRQADSFSERRAGGSGRVDEPAPVKSATPLPDVVIPKGPRSNIPQRNASYFAPRGPRRLPSQHGNQPLPAGWFSAVDTQGRTYYYTNNQTVTWVRPTIPAVTRPVATPALKGPSKAQKERDAVQELIDSLTRETPKVASGSQTPRAASTPTQEPKREKWRSLPVEKQMKLYENTLFASVKSVVDKYRHKLPKAELKKFAKEVNKKLVASDYKNNRVDDPTRISSKVEKKVKAYVRDFFDKAVIKYQAHEKRVKERTEQQSAADGVEASEATPQADDATVGLDEGAAVDDDVVMSDVEVSPASSSKKRKREGGEEQSPSFSPEETPPVKRLKEDEGDAHAPTPPPPPPPPPADAPNGLDDDLMMAEERELAAEAQRREEEAEQHRMQEEALQRENEEAMREFEKEQGQKVQDRAKVEDARDREQGSIDTATHTNGTNGDLMVNGASSDEDGQY